MNMPLTTKEICLNEYAVFLIKSSSNKCYSFERKNNQRQFPMDNQLFSVYLTTQGSMLRSIKQYVLGIIGRQPPTGLYSDSGKTDSCKEASNIRTYTARQLNEFV